MTEIDGGKAKPPLLLHPPLPSSSVSFVSICHLPLSSFVVTTRRREETKTAKAMAGALNQW
ncbi:unnamed protein product [Linum tenue]|uniref:Uncharacterized protein n=1 Tax=Linum tenue TaxID=586396 RepID=A0AAV0M8Z7_9ROSI|nr:unnamed protein product [Linum tenue]